MNSDFTSNNCLFEVVKLAKNADLDKYVYSDYGTGFDSRLLFSLATFDWGKNLIIFGVDMSSSVHVHNKKKYNLIFCKKLTQGADNTILAAGAQY